MMNRTALFCLLAIFFLQSALKTEAAAGVPTLTYQWSPMTDSAIINVTVTLSAADNSDASVQNLVLKSVNSKFIPSFSSLRTSSNDNTVTVTPGTDTIATVSQLPPLAVVVFNYHVQLSSSILWGVNYFDNVTLTFGDSQSIFVVSSTPYVMQPPKLQSLQSTSSKPEGSPLFSSAPMNLSLVLPLNFGGSQDNFTVALSSTNLVITSAQLDCVGQMYTAVGSSYSPSFSTNSANFFLGTVSAYNTTYSVPTMTFSFKFTATNVNSVNNGATASVSVVFSNGGASTFTFTRQWTVWTVAAAPTSVSVNSVTGTSASFQVGLSAVVCPTGLSTVYNVVRSSDGGASYEQTRCTSASDPSAVVCVFPSDATFVVKVSLNCSDSTFNGPLSSASPSFTTLHNGAKLASASDFENGPVLFESLDGRKVSASLFASNFSGVSSFSLTFFTSANPPSNLPSDATLISTVDFDFSAVSNSGPVPSASTPSPIRLSLPYLSFGLTDETIANFSLKYFDGEYKSAYESCSEEQRSAVVDYEKRTYTVSVCHLTRFTGFIDPNDVPSVSLVSQTSTSTSTSSSTSEQPTGGVTVVSSSSGNPFDYSLSTGGIVGIAIAFFVLWVVCIVVVVYLVVRSYRRRHKRKMERMQEEDTL